MRLPFKMHCPPSTLSSLVPVSLSADTALSKTQRAFTQLVADKASWEQQLSFAPKPSQVQGHSLLRSHSDAPAWSQLHLLLNSATVSACQTPLKTLGAPSVMGSLTATRTMLARAVLVGNAPSAILLFETSFAIGPIERGYSLRKRRQACSSLNDLKITALLDDGQLTCLCHRTLALLLRLTWPSRPPCGRRLSMRRRDKLWLPPLHTQEPK